VSVIGGDSGAKAPRAAWVLMSRLKPGPANYADQASEYVRNWGEDRIIARLCEFIWLIWGLWLRICWR
jgi:hypothetical protein